MNFDRIAPFYDAMETVSAGRLLDRCRLEFLDRIQPPARILLVGEGNGRFLLPCRKRFPDAGITVIDGSAKMLEIARRRLGDSRRTEFVHALIGDWRGPDGKFDLIVTNFMLDCLTAAEMAATIRHLAGMAAPDADWLIADFEIPARGPARWRSRAIVGMLYRFFRIVTRLQARSLVAPDAALAAEGFLRAGRRVRDWGLLKSEWWRRVAV